MASPSQAMRSVSSSVLDASGTFGRVDGAVSFLLDGTPMGETPKSRVQVKPGTHTVTFVNAELGKKSVSVKVGPGETKTASAKLRAD